MATDEIIPTVDAQVISAKGEDIINTLDTTSFEGKIKILNALNSAVSLKNTKKPINVVDVLRMPGVRKSRDGAPDKDCLNTYLISEDGKVYFSQSEGIARSVGYIYALFPDMGKSTEFGHLTLKVIEQELPNGNTIKNLAIDM
jgi:hypothetical protein